jgi:hypothetical protein
MESEEVRSYRRIRDARIAKEQERDVLGRIDLPPDDSRHLSHRDEGTQRAWRLLDEEVRRLTEAEEVARQHAGVDAPSE